MDAIECIVTRKSIRKFLPGPVPKEILREVIAAALRSPSYLNTQPWEAVVVSGAKKDALAEMLAGLIERDAPVSSDLPKPGPWPAVNDARIKDNAAKRAQALGQNNSAPDFRKQVRIANSRFYGAPHGIFLYQDTTLPPWSLMDIGGFAQTLMLAAHAKGLGAVPQGYLTEYSPEVKAFLGIPESKRLVLGMSIGYPDLSAPAAKYQSPRASVDEIVRWVE
ncbi:MAG: nitroreductase [Nitrospinae bacterium]|nr:nitroreductase [Nitrospinota bacterium]